jgi:hypothetical protein
VDKLASFGLFKYSVRFPSTMNLHLSVYYEQENLDAWDASGWGAVYKPESDPSSLSCSERYSHAAATFPLRTMSTAHQVATTTVNDMAVEGYAYFKSSNPKYFFIALANCDPKCACDTLTYPDCKPPAGYEAYCSGPLVAEYDFSFTNGEDSTLKHFGYDEVGILATSWTFLVTYTLLVFLAALTVKKPLKLLDKYHVTVKLLITSIWAMWAGLLANTYHYQEYAANGVGKAGFLVIGKLCFSAAEVLLVLHFILCAKGWTIVRRKISANGRVKIAIATTAYTIIHGVTRWFALTQVDKGDILYEYETPPGKVLQQSRLFAAVWFAYAVYTTMKDFPQNKKRFYKKYGVVFGLWFMWMVFSGWIAGGMPDYVSAEAVQVYAH